jgi:hypothetical protein
VFDSDGRGNAGSQAADVVVGHPIGPGRPRAPVNVYNMKIGKVHSPLLITLKYEVILATWLFPWN